MLGIHQDIGIGVCQKMKKKRQKNCGHKHGHFFVSDDRIQKFFDQREIKKMSLSVQRWVESFKFNDKNIRVVHIKNVGQCFVGIDVSKAVGYNDDDNAWRAVQTHVPGKYRMCLGDAQNILRTEVDTDLPNEDVVLLKEPGLYCFL